ncbi:PD-(D/E)XK nuclease family protein [Kitasatospora sp. NPDC050543]|uniref:PD-(D/E)XK nuclease family protein n=1 Tax=Kitasatospora sp. NPDC050543 TaxID=3364054 RepID=UPI003791E497
MTVGTIRRSGARFYIDPEDGDRKLPGVTSILSMLPKDFLRYWAAKLVAETAVNRWEYVHGLIQDDPDGMVDYLKRAPDRFTRQAASTGTEAHDLFERLARGERVGRVSLDMTQYARHFAEFLQSQQPEFIHLEETVWSDTHGYAGSFDAIARIDGEVVILDWKTTRSGVHEDVALQLKAYAMADRIILAADGSSVPVPTIDAAAVLHVRPEGAKLVPADCSDDLFDFFCALIKVFDWETGRKRRVIGKPVWSTGVAETGTERRAG